VAPCPPSEHIPRSPEPAQPHFRQPRGPVDRSSGPRRAALTRYGVRTDHPGSPPAQLARYGSADAVAPRPGSDGCRPLVRRWSTAPSLRGFHGHVFWVPLGSVTASAAGWAPLEETVLGKDQLPVVPVVGAVPDAPGVGVVDVGFDLVDDHPGVGPVQVDPDQVSGLYLAERDRDRAVTGQLVDGVAYRVLAEVPKAEILRDGVIVSAGTEGNDGPAAVPTPTPPAGRPPWPGPCPRPAFPLAGRARRSASAPAVDGGSAPAATAPVLVLPSVSLPSASAHRSVTGSASVSGSAVAAMSGSKWRGGAGRGGRTRWRRHCSVQAALTRALAPGAPAAGAPVAEHGGGPARPGRPPVRPRMTRLSSRRKGCDGAPGHRRGRPRFRRHRRR